MPKSNFSTLLERNLEHNKPRPCCGTPKWDDHRDGCQFSRLMHKKQGRAPTAMSIAFAEALAKAS